MSLAPWVLHPGSGSDLLILWHGAGADIDQAILKTVAERWAAARGPAVRARLPYRRAGKKLPDRMPILVADARTTVAAVRASLERPPTRLFLGGRSLGGRVSSMLAAEGDPVDGLVFLSYPLHSEKAPDRLRDAHLGQISAPMLFVQGDRDALAELPRLEPVLARLGARAQLALYPGADHSFKKVDPTQVAERVLAWAAGLKA